MKRRVADYAVWFLVALCACVLVCMLSWPALAQEIVQGRGVICDTKEQVEQFITLSTDGETPLSVIEKVNEAAQNDKACAIATVAFAIGADVGQVRNHKGLWRIVPIIIVAANMGMGWQNLPLPFEQFTALKITETEL